MTLKQISDNGVPFEIRELSNDKKLAKEVQARLIELSLLDPPADGDFGPVSRGSLEVFAKIKKISVSDFISADLAKALIETEVDSLFPITFNNKLGSKLIQYMQVKKLWFSRFPKHLNIIYVEGMNKDGSLNDDEPNVFNDLRLVICFENGTPEIVGSWEATSEPGAFWTNHPMNPKGAARIAFGQYKAWRVGVHPRKGGKGSHEALVQVGEISVHRDLNKNFTRTGDAVDVGSSFGVNQHWGYDLPVNDIGRASAGCLVGRTKDGHREFMKIIKTDPRFTASNGYKYMTTVIAGDDFKKTIA
jgi:hypothetical protein